MAGRVLVLGDDDRSCLTVVRSLGRKGVEVWLGSEEPASLVPYSRYVRRTFLWPSTQRYVEAWCGELRGLLERERVDLVIPCADNTLVPIVERRSLFEPLARLAIPDDAGFDGTHSKRRTLELAEELGVPIPATMRVETREQAAALLSDARFPFPLVVKPVSSRIWKDARRFDLKVRTVRDPEEFSRLVAELLPVTSVLVQSWVPGIGVGQEFLASEGRIVDAFQHERVHEPLAGGGSSYRKSVPLDARLLECSKGLLSRLRWTGVAMVEYRQDPKTGNFVLMEINGRFWGSLPLAVAAGVDFPYRLYRLMTTPPPPTSDEPPSLYRLGIHARNLSKDLAWYRERDWTSGALFRELARGARRTLTGHERIDTWALDDPRPGLVELARGVSAPLRKLARRVRSRLETWLFRFLTARPSWRRAQKRRLRRLSKAAPRLLFVCRGNICRSPFAELYARQRLGGNVFALRSAGSYPVEGRTSPPEAVAAGRALGVSLDAHRSRTLTKDLVDWAGVILCMDDRDRGILRTSYPSARGKIFYLGAFAPPSASLQIADPWSQPPERYASCYRELTAAVDGLIATLGEGDGRVETEGDHRVAKKEH
jgi:predicted ATP-grasp superfamily ATP-dependent carboligase/protein-tyrosine-phosphatase